MGRTAASASRGTAQRDHDGPYSEQECLADAPASLEDCPWVRSYHPIVGGDGKVSEWMLPALLDNFPLETVALIRHDFQVVLRLGTWIAAMCRRTHSNGSDYDTYAPVLGLVHAADLSQVSCLILSFLPREPPFT